MAVDSILEKLEIASCKLNQLTDFHDQFGSLRKDIGTVASPSIAQQVADRTSHLKQEATRLSNRINDLLTRNVRGNPLSICGDRCRQVVLPSHFQYASPVFLWFLFTSVSGSQTI